MAVVGGRLLTDLVDVTDDPACLDSTGFWAVVRPDVYQVNLTRRMSAPLPPDADVCESTTGNVFVVLDGEIVTPPLSSGCLRGITREILLGQGIGVEGDLLIGVLADADEVFLTNTLRGVLPVRRIDGHVLRPCPGPVTRHAAEVYADLVATGQEL